MSVDLQELYLKYDEQIKDEFRELKYQDSQMTVSLEYMEYCIEKLHSIDLPVNYDQFDKNRQILEFLNAEIQTNLNTYQRATDSISDFITTLFDNLNTLYIQKDDVTRNLKKEYTVAAAAATPLSPPRTRASVRASARKTRSSTKSRKTPIKSYEPPRSASVTALSNTYYREEHNKRIKYLNKLELRILKYDSPDLLYSNSEEESHFFKKRINNLKYFLKKCDDEISEILTVLFEQEDETKDLVDKMSTLKNQQNPKLFKRLKEDYARNLIFLRELRITTLEVVDALYERKKYIREKLLKNMLFLKQEATRRVYGHMMNL
jgi:hypothetical protein